MRIPQVGFQKKSLRCGRCAPQDVVCVPYRKANELLLVATAMHTVMPLWTTTIRAELFIDCYTKGLTESEVFFRYTEQYQILDFLLGRNLVDSTSLGVNHVFRNLEVVCQQ